MQTLDSMVLQLDDLDNIPALKVQLAECIFRNLFQRKDALDDWEKDHFANSITALALNVDALQQPTNAWLRLCLIDLEKALIPKEKRTDRYFRTRTDAVDRDYEQLVARLHRIGIKLGMANDWCATG
jgi:hypothetical protein